MKRLIQSVVVCACITLSASVQANMFGMSKTEAAEIADGVSTLFELKNKVVLANPKYTDYIIFPIRFTNHYFGPNNRAFNIEAQDEAVRGAQEVANMIAISIKGGIILTSEKISTNGEDNAGAQGLMERVITGLETRYDQKNIRFEKLNSLDRADGRSRFVLYAVPYSVLISTAKEALTNFERSATPAEKEDIRRVSKDILEEIKESPEKAMATGQQKLGVTRGRN